MGRKESAAQCRGGAAGQRGRGGPSRTRSCEAMKGRGRSVVNRRRQRRYSAMGHCLTSLGPRNGPFPSLPASEQTQIRKGLLFPVQQRGWSLIPLLESGKTRSPDLPADCSSLAMMMAVRAASRYCFKAMYKRNRYLAS